eukprot:13699014-Alexandrium_andersonii.AAC.1
MSKQLGAQAQQLKPAVRAVMEQEPCSLMQLAASKAFWKTTATDLKLMAKFVQIELSDPSSLVDIVYDMVSTILNIEDREVMAILQLRMAGLEHDMEYTPLTTCWRSMRQCPS